MLLEEMGSSKGHIFMSSRLQMVFKNAGRMVKMLLLLLAFLLSIPAGICLFKISNGNTRIISESCSKLRIKTPELRNYFVVTTM